MTEEEEEDVEIGLDDLDILAWIWYFFDLTTFYFSFCTNMFLLALITTKGPHCLLYLAPRTNARLFKYGTSDLVCHYLNLPCVIGNVCEADTDFFKESRLSYLMFTVFGSMIISWYYSLRCVLICVTGYAVMCFMFLFTV